MSILIAKLYENKRTPNYYALVRRYRMYNTLEYNCTFITWVFSNTILIVPEHIGKAFIDYKIKLKVIPLTERDKDEYVVDFIDESGKNIYKTYINKASYDILFEEENDLRVEKCVVENKKEQEIVKDRISKLQETVDQLKKEIKLLKLSLADVDFN